MNTFSWNTGDKFENKNKIIVAGTLEIWTNGIEYVYYYLNGETFKCPKNDFINVLRSIGSDI